MKASLQSRRECERKIQYLEDKLKKAKEKNSKLSNESRYLKKRNKVLLKSRDSWKAKNRSKSNKIKGLKRKEKVAGKLKRHHYSFLVVSLCVYFRVQAGCTYRGITKILVILQSCVLLNISKIPCANTIENWVSKMGYYQFETQLVDWQGKKVCIIVDERITKGNDRVLLILCTPLQKEKQEPLSRKDVRVCYLGSKDKWDGESIKDEIKKVMATTGMQVKLFLSDEDSKLKKAARLLDCPYLPDINHAVATCLRNVFEKDADYLAFRQQIVCYQRKSACQTLSYLHPPRQRTKARFMNQKKMVKWASLILEGYPRLNKEEQIFFKDLANHSSILKVLQSCIEIGEQLALLLKSKGLCKVSLLKAEQLVDGIKDTKKQMQAFIVRIKKYLQKYKEHLQQNKGVFNTCSDIVESMFGQHKKMEASNTLVGLSQLDLELSLHCLEKDQLKQGIRDSLESVFMTDLIKWQKEHSSDNQLIKRRKFFKKRPQKK